MSSDKKFSNEVSHLLEQKRMENKKREKRNKIFLLVCALLAVVFLCFACLIIVL